MTENGNYRADQIAPHSVEAEEAVIGAVLLKPETIFDVMPFLKADDFFIVRHGWIWETMVSLQERREPIDHLTVVTDLEQRQRLEEVGGAAYVLSLMSRTPSALNVEGYGRIVEHMALRRRLIDAASQIARVAHSEETNIDDVVNSAEQAIFEVTERRLTRELVPIRHVADDYYDHVYNQSNRQEGLMGVPSGFIDLDAKLGGFQRSDLIIVAARPGMGKTSWLNSVMLNAASNRQRVATFSLEMSNEQVVQRLISAESNIPSQKLREGSLEGEDWEAFTAATHRISSLSVFLDDTPALNTQELRSKARRLHMEYGLDLIVIDYLQLLTTPFRTDNRVQEISYISRSLKQLARELNVPVIAAAQLSRAVEQRGDKRPLLSDLRESGSIEQDADIVMFIYRDKYYNPDSEHGDRAEIQIAKHRNGPTGMINLVFIERLAQFRNAATTPIDLDRI
ncbi:MAG: replicative DNA helicase [Chloroflexi bacterium]|nr:replicative DNA helicase [Chloroflexota bacterium]